jgi:serine/threonine protein phosphatase 1
MDKLGTLIDRLDIEFERDTVVFIGDYIDRGPRSFEVVEYLINFKKRHQNIVFLKGNHEDMLEKYLSGIDRFTYLANGGQQTLDSYLEQDRTPKTFPIPDSHLDFFKSLVLFFETDQYIFVHAGLKNKIPLDLQKTHDLLWIRSEFIHSFFQIRLGSIPARFMAISLHVLNYPNSNFIRFNNENLHHHHHPFYYFI